MGSFGGIALLLVVSQVLAYLQWRNVEHEVGVIERNALASIELLARMQDDIQRERILIGRHIFEHETLRMKELEPQIAAATADFQAAARAYTPLVLFAGEAGAWAELRTHVASAERFKHAALELSRQDRDAEATQQLIDAEPKFELIARDMKTLTAINDTEAESARAQVTEMHLHLLDLGLALAGGVLAITFVVGVQVTGMISRNERELLHTTTELEDANRELDAFAGRVAHDLRGPLGTISLAATMITPPDPKPVVIMRRGIDQMTTMIEDLLRLSRAGTPTEGASSPVDMVAQTVAADLGAKVAEAGGVLRVEVEPAHVVGTDSLVRQAVWNLVENALKYRKPEVPPAISLVGHRTPEGYVLEVSDNGIGMTAEELRRACEPLFRGERTRATTPGTGLGLATVRRIVETSGGTMAIESQLDHGTKVALRLRLAPSADA